MSASTRFSTEIITTLSSDAADRQSLAIAIHDYVRDNVLFGFTPWFDSATPERTLRLGIGHCNPQAMLMVELFRSADFEARFRPSTITNAILHGVAFTPSKLSHIFTEVKMNERWVRLDSYIVDEKLRQAAKSKLKAMSQICGYGCHVSATGIWDGHQDSYSQIATPDMVLELHDPVEDIEEFYRSSLYQHKHGPIRYNALFAPGRLMPSLAMMRMNKRIANLRQKA